MIDRSFNLPCFGVDLKYDGHNNCCHKSLQFSAVIASMLHYITFIIIQYKLHMLDLITIVLLSYFL